MVVGIGGTEGLDGPIYLDPGNPNHQAAIEQLRASRQPAVPYSRGGIGNMRDLGDPNDPRRGTSVPQANNTPGLPGVGDILNFLQRGNASETPAASGPQVVGPAIEPTAAELGNRTWQPGAEPLDWIVEARRMDRAQNPPGSDGPLPAPTQQPVRSQSNETFTTNRETPTRFGAGGGAQITPPMSSSRGPAQILTQEDGTRILTQATRGNRVQSTGIQTAIDNRNSAPVRPRYVSAMEATPTDLPNLPPEVTRPGETASAQLDADARALADELSSMGLALTEEDVSILREYVGEQRPSEVVEDTRVVLTADGKKAKGFGNLSDSQINPRYTGSRPIPNQTAPEISPFTPIQVPIRGRDGQVSGTKTIDPQATFRTEQAGPEAMRNALHIGDDEVATSVANRASGLKQDHRTPMISSDQFSQGLNDGTIVQISPKGSHVADQINPDGTRTPIFATRVRDKSEAAAPMFRKGSPTNVNYDGLRDEANPRYKEESGPFDTQVVTDRSGRQIETGPVPFLNREDVYDKTAGIRRNIERGASVKPQKGEKGPYLDHLSDPVQRRIAQAMSDRPTGGTREERIAHDTASNLVAMSRSGTPYIDTKSIASPVVGLEQAITELDEVMNAVAGSGYMESPSVADGYQRMAVAIQRGELDPNAVPERARGEVARELQMLQSTQRTPERVPIQTEAVITERAPDSEADLTAGLVRGDERNFDGNGAVVQGSYGDFGEASAEKGGMRGYSVQNDPTILASQPEVAARFAVADALGVRPDVRGEFGPEMTAQLDQMGQAVLRHARTEISLGKGSDFGGQLGASANQLFKRNVEQVAPRRPSDVHDRGFKGFVQDIAVSEEATAIPQSASQGVANTQAVSQLNAPAPAGGVEVDPRISALIEGSGGGIRQSQIDLIQRGLSATPGSEANIAAESLLRRYRR